MSHVVERKKDGYGVLFVDMEARNPDRKGLEKNRGQRWDGPIFESVVVVASSVINAEYQS